MDENPYKAPQEMVRPASRARIGDWALIVCGTLGWLCFALIAIAMAVRLYAQESHQWKRPPDNPSPVRYSSPDSSTVSGQTTPLP
jgi:hypothetical protein